MCLKINAFLGGIVYRLRSIVSWPTISFLMLIHLTIVLICWPFVKEPREFSIQLSRYFCRTILWVSGVRFQVHGIENIPKTDPFIIYANHQSFLDIPILVVIIDRGLRFIAKKELKWIPIVGWNIYLQGHHLIDRSNSKQAKEVLNQASKQVLAGHPIIIFPEGTRSLDGQLSKFKRGSFKIAIENHIHVLPIYIHNAYKVLNKKTWYLTPGIIDIYISKAIPPITDFEDSNRQQIDQLTEQTQGIIQDLQDRVNRVS